MMELSAEGIDSYERRYPISEAREKMPTDQLGVCRVAALISILWNREGFEIKALAGDQSLWTVCVWGGKERELSLIILDRTVPSSIAYYIGT